MPTYEYRCEACGHEFEEFQSITAKPIKKCPKCGKPSVKRLISSGAGFIFHGSGFYQTDYRSEQYRAAASKDSDAGKAAAPAPAGTSQGDSTTATPSGSKALGTADSKTPPPATPAAPSGGEKKSSSPTKASKSAAKTSRR